jgi:tryptophan-rich sensory protein
MDWPSLIKAIAVCLISITIEAVSASKEGKQWFASLKRPKYSFSFQVWYIVGAAYYVLFGIITYRQFAMGKNFFSLSVILLLFVMLINGLSNFVVFKFHSIKWFYLIIYPFALLLLTLIIVLYPIDMISTVLASLYFIWLFFDLYYAYNLWKRNKNNAEEERKN